MEATQLREAERTAVPPVAPLPSDEERRSRLVTFLDQSMSALYRSRRLLLGLVVLVGIASAVIALRIPNQYEAQARVLAPDASSSMLSSLLGGGGSSANMARRFLGSGSSVGTYTRPMAILTSRSVNLAVVDSFKLVQVYKLQDAKAPREEALKELFNRAGFGIDDQFEFLSIGVRDENPRRAADMANLYVRLLNRTSTELSTQNARDYRRFIETRYVSANRAVDSLLDAATAFQRRYGVIDLPAQAEAYYAQMGTMRGEQARLQVQLQALRSQFGPEASEVKATEQALAEATRQYRAAEGGAEAAFPVSRGALPAVAREYAQLERERRVQAATLEVLGPMYEAARMEEGRQVETVQVLDLAVPPSRKVAPARTLIVGASVISALLLGLALVLARDQWRRYRPALQAWAQRVEAAAP